MEDALNEQNQTILFLQLSACKFELKKLISPFDC